MRDGAEVIGDRRAAAVTGFAAALRTLREAAGNPSFREMSGRSRAISHTTLHEAARGHRLPSWPTVVEFVKACDGDPAAFRQQWEEADRALREPPPSDERPATEPATEPAADLTAEPATEPVEDDAAGIAAAPPVATAPSRRRRLLSVGLAAVAVVGIAGGIVALTAGSDDRQPSRRPSVAEVAPAADDCPRLQRNPPPAPPRHPGDHGRFITDVTYPDCSHVARGSTFLKVWRFKNAGSVPWRDYSLHRVDPARRGTCQTITDVPIATTSPGQMVDVRTEVTAPPNRGFCYARFRIVDAAGADAFPAGRSITFQVFVD